MCSIDRTCIVGEIDRRLIGLVLIRFQTTANECRGSLPRPPGLHFLLWRFLQLDRGETEAVIDVPMRSQ